MQRLKTRLQFQAVLAGAIVAKTEHFAMHRNRLDVHPPEFLKKRAASATRASQAGVLPTDSFAKSTLLFPFPDAWIGAMVPRRWAKRAVTRNAIKRQIYAISDDLAETFPQAAFVVRLRKEFSRQQFISAESALLGQAVRAEVSTLLLTALHR